MATTNGEVLTEEIANQFLECYSSVDLRDFTSIEDDAAKVFANYRHPEGEDEDVDLLLMGLTSLSDTAAEALAKFKGVLHLDGLTTLSDAAAETFAKENWHGLSLDGLTTLSDTAAEAFAKHKGGLIVMGLTSLSDTAAEALSKHRKLNVSDEVEEILSKYPRPRYRKPSG